MGGVRKARGDGGVKKCVWEVRGKVCGGRQGEMRGVKKCGRIRGTVYSECGKVVGCRDRWGERYGGVRKEGGGVKK